ncbi:hypothetical protein [Silvibacterium acidisoli]|uniref:hypothetical protein n=1 Tax=Acidobacteriaceae bacterium ZG23-2 TaxID=2883246 RepID=UPI00406CB463
MQLRSALALGMGAFAATGVAQQQPIAYVPTQNVSVSGSLSVENGKASIGNNGTITANDSTAHVSLARGGDLRVCASTKVSLSKDSSAGPAAGNDSALMIALDRGAIEASYTPGKYSDVLLTPDLRILVSGPGQADLKVRINSQGDTCIDNPGANAPYVTVTSQFEGGLYRVQPNQRVMFEHGSLQQVVDNEKEPCGCPVAAPVSVAEAAPGIVTNHANPAQPGKPVGGPSSTPADTEFPLAVSEGLKPPPVSTAPVVPAGTPHAEVTAPISFDANATPNPSAPGAAGKEPEPAPTAQPTAAPAAQPTPAPKQDNGGVFHHIGRFFAKLFGR